MSVKRLISGKDVEKLQTVHVLKNCFEHNFTFFQANYCVVRGSSHYQESGVKEFRLFYNIHLFRDTLGQWDTKDEITHVRYSEVGSPNEYTNYCRWQIQNIQTITQQQIGATGSGIIHALSGVIMRLPRYEEIRQEAHRAYVTDQQQKLQKLLSEQKLQVAKTRQELKNLPALDQIPDFYT